MKSAYCYSDPAGRNQIQEDTKFATKIVAMQKQILADIKEIKSILANLIGTDELPATDQFSLEAISKAAKQFQKMKIERGGWVKESDIGRYLKGADWRTGKFIRAEFSFSNCIKQGHYFLYNKNDLVSLNAVLKEKNIDIKRYMEYKWDEADFKKKATAVKKTTKGKKPFHVPAGLKDITTSPIPMPDPVSIKNDLARLKEEFFLHKMAEYIDIYKDNHAMMKFIYHFEKYLEPQLKRRCKKWCEDFNYANHALEMVTKKKEIFVPVKEEEMIEL